MVRMNAGYDVVVVGDGLPLLTTGLTLLRGGARTLLISLARQEQDGLAPMLPDLTPYIEGVDLFGLFRELGLAPAELKQLRLLNPAFQLLLPKKRLELTADDEEWLKMSEREYGESQGEVWMHYSQVSHQSRVHALKAVQNLAAFTALPPYGLREHLRNRHAIRRLRALHRHRPFRSRDEFWPTTAKALALMLTAGTPSTPLHQGSADQLISLSRFGSLEARVLTPLLRQHLNKRGGEFLTLGHLQSIEARRRDLTSLTLKGSDLEKVHFGTMILATYPHRILPYLHPVAACRSMQKWLMKLRIAYDRHLLPITIMKEAVPQGMAPRALMIGDPEKPLLHENLLLIDREECSDGKSILWTRLITEHGRLCDVKLQSAVLAQLKKVIPFLAENIIPSNAPAKLHGHIYGSADANRRCLLYGLPSQTPFKNLLHASGANLPELGLEGELLASIKTAQVALISRVHRDLGGYVLERNSIST